MSNEMTLNDALTYIFGDTQEERLAMEEAIDMPTDDYLDNIECPLDNINNNVNSNMKGNDNMTTNNEMKMMMEQMQAMMAQMQQMTSTIASLQQENNTLKTQLATPKTTSAIPYNKEQAMHNAKMDTVMDRYMTDVNRDDWKQKIRDTQDDKNISNDIIVDISDRLYECLNPSQYASVLNDYTAPELQAYYQRELTMKGLFSKEYDNLDSMDKNQLIQGIKNSKEEDFIERLKANGKKIYASEKQLELLKQNGINTENIKYWWDASPLLEGIFGEDKPATKTQLDKIQELVVLTGAVGFNLNPSTKREASQIINQLMDEKEEMFGIELASEKQIELYRTMCKTLGQTVPRVSTLEKVSSRDLSKMINKIASDYNKVAVASEGQIKFLTSLHKQLMKELPENITNKTISKNDATKLIDSLSRELLYVKMRRTMGTITMQEINKLSSKEVQAKLQDFRANRR